VSYSKRYSGEAKLQKAILRNYPANRLYITKTVGAKAKNIFAPTMYNLSVQRIDKTN